jgi:hypothetical protein
MSRKGKKEGGKGWEEGTYTMDDRPPAAPRTKNAKLLLYISAIKPPMAGPPTQAAVVIVC